MQRMKTLLLAMVTALGFAILAALPITVHADGGDTTVIHACVLNKDGSTRIVSATTTCKNNETPLHWANVARVSAIETKNTTQDGQIATAQSTNTTQYSARSLDEVKRNPGAQTPDSARLHPGYVLPLIKSIANWSSRSHIYKNNRPKDRFRASTNAVQLDGWRRPADTHRSTLIVSGMEIQKPVLSGSNELDRS